MNTITFLWIDPCHNARLERAQSQLKESVFALGLKPVCFECGPAMVKFADVLRFAREHAKGDSFVWCNSDVILARDPYETNDLTKVHGFHRREIPGGEICGGEDMYLIPNGIWDDLLSKDIPDLWCGATHVDWWLTNAASIAGKYRSHTGFIDHRSHETSGASKRRSNKFYLHNIKRYNKWASKHGATIFLERIDLPIVRESLSPLTDLWRYYDRKTAC
jgi:hypothetical protein